MKRPDVPARGLVLAAIKLDIRKRQVRYPRMEIDLHTMTGGDRGIERSWPRVRGIGGWLGGGGRAKRKVRSRIRRRGRMTKLSFPKRKIVRATSILRGSFVVDESRFEDFLARKILARSA